MTIAVTPPLEITALTTLAVAAAHAGHMVGSVGLLLAGFG